MKVRIKRMGEHNLPVPAYETPGAAGMDLRANLADLDTPGTEWIESGVDIHPVSKLPTRYIWLFPDAHVYLPVGFAFEIPDGFEGQVRPRSGLAKKHKIVAWHPIGTVDSDYRGEVMAALHNRGDEPFTIWEGDRIAQLVIAPVVRAELVEVAALGETGRGAKGFGSTGTGSGEVTP
jgi:dUTP pyrophosphatase